MSWPDEVVCGEFGVDGHAYDACAFGCGDAGGEAVLGMSVDGDGEGRAADGGVAGGLGFEFEPVAVVFGEAEAEVAARFAEHEGDGFGCGVLGGHDEVAFVFA